MTDLSALQKTARRLRREFGSGQGWTYPVSLARTQDPGDSLQKALEEIGMVPVRVMGEREHKIFQIIERASRQIEDMMREADQAIKANPDEPGTYDDIIGRFRQKDLPDVAARYAKTAAEHFLGKGRPKTASDYTRKAIKLLGRETPQIYLLQSRLAESKKQWVSAYLFASFAQEFAAKTGEADIAVEASHIITRLSAKVDKMQGFDDFWALAGLERAPPLSHTKSLKLPELAPDIKEPYDCWKRLEKKGRYREALECAHKVQGQLDNTHGKRFRARVSYRIERLKKKVIAPDVKKFLQGFIDRKEEISEAYIEFLKAAYEIFKSKRFSFDFFLSALKDASDAAHKTGKSTHAETIQQWRARFQEMWQDLSGDMKPRFPRETMRMIEEAAEEAQHSYSPEALDMDSV